MTFAVITALGLAGAPCCQVQPPEFTRAKIDSTLGGWHATTRGTVRLVFVHRGRWLVFRGGPNAYHFSSDGVTWTYTEAQQASRSHFIDGDSIYTQYSVDMDPAPDKWDFKHYACVGAIGEEAIAWGEPAELPLRLTYYPDIQRDGGRGDPLGPYPGARRLPQLGQWGALLPALGRRDSRTLEASRQRRP